LKTYTTHTDLLTAVHYPLAINGCSGVFLQSAFVLLSTACCSVCC